VLRGTILCLHQYGTHTCWRNNPTAVCSLSGEQVKQSQEHLLERLYAYVTGLKPQELDMLLDEDSELTQKRAAAQMTIKVGLVQPGIATSGLCSRLLLAVLLFMQLWHVVLAPCAGRQVWAE